jgi:hypothetical protein
VLRCNTIKAQLRLPYDGHSGPTDPPGASPYRA